MTRSVVECCGAPWSSVEDFGLGGVSGVGGVHGSVCDQVRGHWIRSPAPPPRFKEICGRHKVRGINVEWSIDTLLKCQGKPMVSDVWGGHCTCVRVHRFQEISSRLQAFSSNSEESSLGVREIP